MTNQGDAVPPRWVCKGFHAVTQSPSAEGRRVSAVSSQMRGFFAEFTLSGKKQILRYAQDDNDRCDQHDKRMGSE